MGKNYCRHLLVPWVVAALVGACIAVPEGAGIPKKLSEQDDGGTAFITVDASVATPDVRNELSSTDPHAVIGVDPPHGPFAGDQRALVRGNGFMPNARVWFGASEVADDKVVRVDSTRLQVSVPPGDPGPVDVRVQNGQDESTSRILKKGYSYDQHFARPSVGPTSGGTLITISGKGTLWMNGTAVQVGGKACENLSIVSPAEMRCTTPKHPPGAVALSVVTPDGSENSVEDGFVYADSENGFKGGLSGNPLATFLQVSVMDNYTGMPVPGALVIAGDSLGTALQLKTDTRGIAVFSDGNLVGTRSVTIARRCYQPITFQDVPVDRVTAYLTPVVSAECAGDSGAVPPVMGVGSTPASIRGELVWPGGPEFKRGSWINVPVPKNPNERQVAYLFTPNGDPTYSLYLPDPSQAILPDANGTIGYEYSYEVTPGNVTIYALAGIENRSVYPPMFVAYAFGMVRGISTIPNQVTEEVFIRMDKTLDQALTLSITPPQPTTRGPDRVRASVAVQIGADGYALLPNAVKTVPMASFIPINIVGLPGLDGVLEGAKYVSTATAATGSNAGVPLAAVGKHVTTDTSIPVTIDGFVQVPQLKTPTPGGKFDGSRLEIQTVPGATPIDITVVQLDAAGGAVRWTVAVPGAKSSVELPDIGSLGVGLPPGPLDVSVYCASVESLDYGSLLYRHLTQRGWSAYSYDVFHVYY